MGLKAKIEAIIYAAEEPITLEQIALLVKDMVLAEEAAEKARLAEPPLDAAEQSDFIAEQPLAEIDAAGAETSSPEMALEAVTEPAPEALAETSAEGSGLTAEAAPEPTDASAAVSAPQATSKKKRKSDAAKKELSEDARVRAYLRPILEQLVADYQVEDRGIEIRQIAGGYKMATKPEHHDVVRAFAKSLKPPVRLSLAALETLAVIAYKQPITVPEISEIRGVESGGVIGTLLDRKLVTTAGRKQVIGRPILYKTSKDFLMRFGLNEISELPSMEEFEKLASDGQGDLFTAQATEAAPTEQAETAEISEAIVDQPAPEPVSNPEQPSEQAEAVKREASTANNS